MKVNIIAYKGLMSLIALDNTGILVEPGNIFKQVGGTYHYRISALAHSEEELRRKMENLYNFNEKFQASYE